MLKSLFLNMSVYIHSALEKDLVYLYWMFFDCYQSYPRIPEHCQHLESEFQYAPKNHPVQPIMKHMSSLLCIEYLI